MMFQLNVTILGIFLDNYPTRQCRNLNGKRVRSWQVFLESVHALGCVFHNQLLSA